MPDLGGAEPSLIAPRPRRARRAVYLAAGLALFASAGVVAAIAVGRNKADDNRGIRFEAETRSGKAPLINWYVGSDERHQVAEAKTPWSISLPATDDQAEMSKTLLVMTTDDDEAICRIIVAGEVTVERTSKKVAACMENMPKS
ncbi:MmpS family transport accessory protein [Paractinoplanes ferrugineus]|nr:MmpS family transport accessory protein [Actinoplanes ferrugineus]